jgi:hypothetical protein
MAVPSPHELEPIQVAVTEELRDPKVIRAGRASPVLVCRKCLKRSSEGGDVRRALKSALKASRPDGGKAAKLVMTGCFGLCPKRSIVVASGVSLKRQEYVLVADRDQVPRALALLNGGASD